MSENKVSKWFRKLSFKKRSRPEPRDPTKLVPEDISMQETILNVLNPTEEQEPSPQHVRIKSQSQSSSSENTNSSNESFLKCGPETCSRDCFTCGPPAVLLQEQSDVEQTMQYRRNPGRRLSRSQRISENIQPKSIDFMPSYEARTNTTRPLVAAPITDEKGQIPTNLNLGEALTLLMKKGIIENPANRDSKTSINTEVLKFPYLESSSSSEASNVEMALPSMKKISIAARQRYMSMAKYSKSIPTANFDNLDKSMNTSAHDAFPTAVFDDSMVKLKLQRDLDEDSCTQYFALKSNLNLEAYLKDQRLRDADKHVELIHVTSDRLEDKPSSDTPIKIQKNLGLLALSRASVWQESEKEITQQYLDNGTDRFVPRRSIAEAAVVQKEGSFPITTENVSPGTPTPKKQSEILVTKKCRTCHPSRIYFKTPEKDRGFSNLGELELNKSNPDPLISEMSDESAKPFVPKHLTKITVFDDIQSDDAAINEGAAQLVMSFQVLQPASALVNLSLSSYNIYERSAKYMFVWTFLQNADSYRFTLSNVEVGDEVELDEPRTYSFTMSPGVYLYLSKVPLSIELFHISFGREALIGKCDLHLGRAFEDLSKTYENSIQLQNHDLCLCYEDLQPMNFGQLIIKFRIVGSQEYFDKCKPVKPPPITLAPLIESRHNREVSIASPISSIFYHPSSVRTSERSNIVSEAELQAFQDGLNLVLVRNKALRTTQDEITQELKDRTNWMHEELKWRLTLQENAILSGKDPDTIKWRQWKDDTTANVRYRPIAHEEFLTDGVAHVEIEILELSLLPDSKPMLNDNLGYIYIELSFVNMSGKNMETLTMRKPVDDSQPVRFQFKRVFDIPMESKLANNVAEMIKNNESIPFTVIAQPVENSSELQCCYDIGNANLVLFDLLQSRNNTAVETIPVHDAYIKEVEIGHLKVKFVGVLAMRSMALHILTPPTFKIIR